MGAQLHLSNKTPKKQTKARKRKRRRAIRNRAKKAERDQEVIHTAQEKKGGEYKSSIGKPQKNNKF